MDKMKMETANKTLENLAKLKEMFPEVITESKDENGEIVAAVDAKKLEQLLSSKVIEGDECYDFTWVGKKQAMVEACKPIRKALRPCREESVDWENTQNLYIEGDNLDVLKLLQESYLNKVKMIYIDPPYNTGNDSFIYPDDYSTNKELYDEEVGAIDESGYRMFKNTETNGRFHSSWCSMMYPRLKLARNLLSEDGVIFISIDDHEVDNLKKICDEVFGENNFVVSFVWKCRNSLQHDEVLVSKQTERVLFYVKNCLVWNNINGNSLNRIRKPFDATEYKNPDNDPRGPWLSSGKTRNDGRPSYTVVSPTGVKFTKPWIPSPTEFKRWEEEKLIWWGKDGTSIPRKKSFLKDFKGNAISDILFDEYTDEIKGDNELKRTKRWEIGTTETGTKGVKEIFTGKTFFDYPKPWTLIKYLTTIASNKNSIILDFFSGSATTAHAVMQLNAEDGGHRKFIMVQLPEICDEKSEAYKAGYKNICEIGKERIRRAGKKIKEETGKKDLDIGFRVLKLDESNMKDVYYAPSDYNQSMLDRMTSNIKEDRTPEDLLYACMLEWGLELSLPHKVENIAGYNVHIVNDGDLIACFDNKISEEAIKQIADKKPLRAVFRDSSFATDASRVNVGEIFKLKSPNTTIKVI